MSASDAPPALAPDAARPVAQPPLRSGSVTYRPIPAWRTLGCFTPVFSLPPFVVACAILVGADRIGVKLVATVAGLLLSVAFPASLLQRGAVRVEVDGAAGTLTLVNPRWPLPARRRTLPLGEVRAVVVERVFDGGRARIAYPPVGWPC
jgi:hypothetical protein